MRRHLPLAALALSLASSPVLAGPYQDDVSKCLVEATSKDDKNLLVQWMFTAMALHPAIKDMAKVSAEQREKLSSQTAAMFTRLLTETCRAPVVKALRYEGPGTLSSSFNLLGQVAGKELFSDAGVAGSLALLDKYVETAKIEALAAEAGALAKPPATTP